MSGRSSTQARPPWSSAKLRTRYRPAGGIDAQTAAQRLEISPNTCRGYIKSLLLKLGAHSQLEAIAVARTSGLLGDD